MFKVADKLYMGLGSLTRRRVGEFRSKWIIESDYPVYTDIYGRKVIHLRERYPCFDSSDFLYEDRYFHWYFIAWDEGLALVYADDGRDGIQTEDHFTEDMFRKYRVTNEHRQCLLDSGLMK